MYKEAKMEISRELLDFIQSSPSYFHVIDNFKKMLLEDGFILLRENEKWKLTAGGKYFVIRGDSSIIAFKIPMKDFSNFQIVASHGDSCTFKIKTNPEIVGKDHYLSLNTEPYGGVIYSPWLDRPLSVAGRVVVKDGNNLRSHLVNFDRDLLVIPNIAIHMGKEINNGYVYDLQKDMLPLVGLSGSKGVLMEQIAHMVGDVDPEDIVGTDLYLYNRAPGTIMGVNDEFIGSPKLDDLQCAYTSMRAFMTGGNNDSVTMCCVFDSEEIGSWSSQGADSTLLSDVVERISDTMGKDMQQHKMALASSFMISADNAHALHPNRMEKADPTNGPLINKGVVIKHNANLKYITDAMSNAVFSGICAKAMVPVQSYANHSNISGGVTLGNISVSHVSINILDIGLPQLAMHSPFETAGTEDTYYLLKALEEFYNTYIARTDDGFELR